MGAGTEERAFRLGAHVKVSEDVYQREVGLIRTWRRWIAEQQERLHTQLADLERYSLSAESVVALRQRVEAHLAGATIEDRRFVLDAVGAKIIAQGDGTWELEVPREVEAEVQTVYTTPGKA